MKPAVLIPAYRPSAALVDVVRAVAQRRPVVIVDDGSGPEFAALFDQAAAPPNVRLLRHPANRGKGAALKTGIEFALHAFPDAAGVVTADADGQHHPDDIERVAQALEQKNGALILGARSFQGEVPLRSRFGNALTRWMVRAVVGETLADTQTGLRAIPAVLLPGLLRLESNGYEFELEMLIAAHQLSVPVIEEPIRTIYEPGNPSSHFNPIVDSMKIYFVLLRFASVSLMTAVLDNLVFYLAYRRTGHILGSQIAGRAVAVAFNYVMVRRSVFYSRQRHLAVLPKYLALVVASGAASYGGIRWLSPALRINPVIAKLMVESLLFFVNFAVQRLFIFHSGGDKREGRFGWVAPLVFVILAAVVAIEIYGFATGHIFQQPIWFPLGMRRFHRYIGLFLEAGVPLLLMFPWLFAAVAAGLMLTGTALAAPMGLLAVAALMLSAWTLGSRLARNAGGPTAILLGLAVYVLLMNLVARLPVNYPLAWAIVIALPIALEPRRAWSGVRGLAGRVANIELKAPAERIAIALLLFVIGMHWLVVLKPENGADAMGMHLAIPVNIAAHHQMTYEPTLFLWSVMPMGADWAYSIAYQLGGESGSRLLNFAMLLLLLTMLHKAMRRWVSQPLALFLTALFAATPVVQYVTGSLFVENFLAAMLFATAAALWRFGETGDRRFLYISAALCGTALSTKVGAFAFLALLLPFAIYEAYRHRIRVASCALAAALLIAAAAPTYVIAWRKTGNPIFPFYNQQIHSRVLDPSVVIRDFRFRQPLTWRTPYDLTFRTSDFYEGQNGSFGLEYLLVAPLAIIGLIVARKRPLAIAAVAGMGAILIVLRSEPNVRYLYAGLPLLFIPFAAMLAWLEAGHRALFRAVLCYLLVCFALNVYMLPASSWYHKEFYSQQVFLRGGRDRFIRSDLPLRDVVLHFSRTHPGKPLLLINDNDIADVTADVYENNWHQYSTWDRIQSAGNRLDMLKLLERWNVGYIVGTIPAPGELVQPRGLRDLLDNCALPEYENRWFFLARVDRRCEDESKAAGRELPVLQPAIYDDFDMGVRFRGNWERTERFAEPLRHTISYADTPGDEASIAFEGKSLLYVFTKAPNRGMADLLIDGVVKATIDLYSPNIEWHSRYQVCCLAPGRHTATVRVLGRKRPEATGAFVDVDAFVVE